MSQSNPSSLFEQVHWTFGMIVGQSFVLILLHFHSSSFLPFICIPFWNTFFHVMWHFFVLIYSQPIVSLFSIKIMRRKRNIFPSLLLIFYFHRSLTTTTHVLPLWRQLHGQLLKRTILLRWHSKQSLSIGLLSVDRSLYSGLLSSPAIGLHSCWVISLQFNSLLWRLSLLWYEMPSIRTYKSCGPPLLAR